MSQSIIVTKRPNRQQEKEDIALVDLVQCWMFDVRCMVWCVVILSTDIVVRSVSLSQSACAVSESVNVTVK